MPITFEEAHEKLLESLDRAYQQIREIHADPSFVNESAKDIREARDYFLHIENKFWNLKSVWFNFRD